jgi:hypothetical protein
MLQLQIICVSITEAAAGVTRLAGNKDGNI